MINTHRARCFRSLHCVWGQVLFALALGMAIAGCSPVSCPEDHHVEVQGQCVLGEDTECTEGAEQVCGSDVGVCVSGTQTCGGDGAWGECIGAVGPVAETCDGEDNDCDGLVDNGDVLSKRSPDSFLYESSVARLHDGFLLIGTNAKNSEWYTEVERRGLDGQLENAFALRDTPDSFWGSLELASDMQGTKIYAVFSSVNTSTLQLSLIDSSARQPVELKTEATTIPVNEQLGALSYRGLAFTGDGNNAVVIGYNATNDLSVVTFDDSSGVSDPKLIATALSSAKLFSLQASSTGTPWLSYSRTGSQVHLGRLNVNDATVALGRIFTASQVAFAEDDQGRIGVLLVDSDAAAKFSVLDAVTLQCVSGLACDVSVGATDEDVISAAIAYRPGVWGLAVGYETYSNPDPPPERAATLFMLSERGDTIDEPVAFGHSGAVDVVASGLSFAATTTYQDFIVFVSATTFVGCW